MGDRWPAPLPKRATHRHDSATEGRGEQSLSLALPVPTHRQGSLTDARQAAGREGVGEALHLRGQTSATRPRYLFVTCLQPARDHFLVRFGLVLCCAQDSAGCAPS